MKENKLEILSMFNMMGETVIFTNTSSCSLSDYDSFQEQNKKCICPLDVWEDIQLFD